MQIIDGLSQQLDPKLFEQCAADLLRSHFPSLVPVSGGGDSGFDGAIADSEGEPFPLIVTTAEDAIGNLTRNLNRYDLQGGTRKKAVFATSRELTPRKWNNLLKRARKLGFTLIQIYEQEAIANLLYHAPRWCKELLGLSGRPSVLSHIPKTARLPIPNQRLIGRDEELQWLLNDEGDKLIIGQPGSGKTSMLYQLATQNRGLFVVSEEQITIANAIREQQPAAIFVDDAGGKLELIAELMHFRRSTGTEFQIIAACWPSDKDRVVHELDLEGANSRHLLPLIRDQIVEVVKEAGLEWPNDLVRHIVDQAVGLPGLATTLARLYLQGDHGAVVSGDILKQDLLRHIKPERKEDAKYILAGFSVGGKAGITMSAVAEALDISLLEIKKVITQLATGGVIADRPHVYRCSSSNEPTISVRPETLRYALVHDVFFSGPAPLSPEILNKLIDQAHSNSDVAETIMGASVYHGNVPETLLEELVVRAGDAGTFKRYVSIGRRQTLWLLGKHPEVLLEVGRNALMSAPEETIPHLLRIPIAPYQLLHRQDTEPLRLIKEWTLSGQPGTDEGLRRRRMVLAETIRWLNQGGDIDVAVCALCIAVSPLYNATTTDPGAGNTYTTTHGLLAPNEIIQLKSLWDDFLNAIADRSDFNWDPIFRALNSWTYPNSLLHSSRIDESPTELHPKTRRAFAETAVAVVEKLAKMASDKPAVAQRLKSYIMATGASARLQVNDVRSLFFRNMHGQDWEADERRRKCGLSALANKWHTREATEVVAEVTGIEQEAMQAGTRTHFRVRIFYEELAQLVKNPVDWCWALMHQNANSDYVTLFFQRAVVDDVNGWLDVAFACLDKPGFRQLAVRLALEKPDLESELFSRVIAIVSDFSDHVEDLCMRGKVPLHVVSLLLEHENRAVAIGCAEGEWKVQPKGHVRESVVESWRLTVIRHGTDERFLEQAFKLDSVLARSWLLEKMQNDAKNRLLPCSRQMDRNLRVAMREQSFDSRALLLSKLGELSSEQQSFTLFYQDCITLVIGDSPALQRQLLEDPKLKGYHLAPLRRYLQKRRHIVFDRSWEQFALLAHETGYTAEQVFFASLPRHYAYIVPESTLHAIWVDDFAKLLSHENDIIRQIGELGYHWATKTRDTLIKKEHLEAVYGRHR